MFCRAAESSEAVRRAQRFWATIWFAGAVLGPDIVMAPEPEHQHGFAFLRKSAIVDQHINTRNRWDDIIPVIKKYPDLLGIGISEGTAIVVTGDRFQVIGKWKVTIHDNTIVSISRGRNPTIFFRLATSTT